MEVELKTAPVDKRFSNTNQARHCYAYVARSQRTRRRATPVHVATASRLAPPAVRRRFGAPHASLWGALGRGCP